MNSDLRLEWVDPKTLTPNPKNWRLHPEPQREALAGVLEDVGWAGALLWNERTQRLVDGHLRLDVALREKVDSVPVLIGSWDEAQEAEILATLDPIAAMATADASQLDALLRDVNSGSAAVMDMLSELAAGAGLYLEPVIGAGGDDFDTTPADESEPTRAQRGDLWQLGEHRLLVDDCTIVANVARLMDGEKAALLATDPPYNVDIEYGDSVDDSKSADAYEAFSRAWFSAWAAVSEKQVTSPGYNNLATWCRLFDKPYHIAPWTKTNSMTRGHVSRFACWEPLLFYGTGWQRERANDVFNFPVGEQRTASGEKLTKLHPCPKPLAMWIDLIENFTEAAAIVTDAFGGSGTTIIAAERTGRTAYLMEIEPRYADVILRRWEAETGEEAVLLERAEGVAV